jgi:hypothetical protein
MPIHAVPKPHSTDLHLVTDHSARPFSLNNMIDHSQVTGFALDNILHLGEMLLDACCSIGNVSLILWKSDIALLASHEPFLATQTSHLLCFLPTLHLLLHQLLNTPLLLDTSHFNMTHSLAL